MARYIVRDDGPDEKEMAAFDRARWKQDRVSELFDGFTLRRRGREGSLYYKEEGCVLELGLELAGKADQDIMISRACLRQWTIPKSQPISLEKQRELETLVREWLKKSGVLCRFVSPEADLVRDR
jgi:hypothetical protein